MYKSKGRRKLKIGHSFPFEEKELSTLCTYLQSSSSIKHRRLLLIVKFASMLGLRKTSILKIRESDVDFETSILLIPSQHTKTGYPEYKRIYGDLIPLLRSWLKTYKKRICESGYVFFSHSKYDKYPFYNPKSLHDVFREVLKDLGMDSLIEVRKYPSGIKRRIHRKRFHDLKAYHHIKVKQTMPDKHLSDLKFITGHRETRSLEMFYLNKGVVSLQLQDEFISRL